MRKKKAEEDEKARNGHDKQKAPPFFPSSIKGVQDKSHLSPNPFPLTGCLLH